MTIEKKTQLEAELATLPHGSLVRRTIRGADRYYHQWREDGRTKSRYLTPEALPLLRAQLSRRAEILLLLNPRKSSAKITLSSSPLVRDVVRGPRLTELTYGLSSLEKRDIFREISNYLTHPTGDRPQNFPVSPGDRPRNFGDRPPKPALVTGLQRTGKTTILRQLIAALPAAAREQAAFLSLTPNDSVEVLLKVLRDLISDGIRILLLDDVFRLPNAVDFLLRLETLADSGNVRLVLTATTSASVLTQLEESVLGHFKLHALTPMTFREWTRLTGTHDLSSFLSSGGILGLSFEDSANAADYLVRVVGKGAAEGIERFLDCLLMNALQMHTHAHSATADDAFLSGDVSRVLKFLTVRTGDRPADGQVRQELIRLGLLASCTHETLGTFLRVETRDLPVCPVLFTHLLKGHLQNLLEGPDFAHLGAGERKLVRETIQTNIQDYLLASIIFSETIRACASARVSGRLLSFSSGTEALVLADSDELTCSLISVTSAATRDADSGRTLRDPRMLDAIEHRYGLITDQQVIYRGRTAKNIAGITFRNAGDYLLTLSAKT